MISLRFGNLLQGQRQFGEEKLADAAAKWSVDYYALFVQITCSWGCSVNRVDLH